MKEKLNIGVVGVGWPGQQHIRGYTERDDAEVVALCDPNTERLSETADLYNVPGRYESFDEMLSKGGLDAVSICTPNAFHADMSIAAMEAGLHVHCEKPMAMNSEQARKMEKVSRETGRVLMIGFQRRFTAAAQYLKKYISSGSMGPIYRAKATWVRRQGIPGFGGWFTTRKMSGGGTLIDIGVHVLDLALWFMDFPKPTGVSASVGSRFGNRGQGVSSDPHWRRTKGEAFDVDDFSFAHVKFENEVSLSLETSWAGHIKEDLLSIELWGEEAGAKIWPLEIYTNVHGELADITPRLEETDPHLMSTAHFVNVIRGREELVCKPLEGVAGLEIVEKIYADAGQSGI